MNDMKDRPLHMSWCDSQWLPVLNQHNVLEYFSERSNPFYDRTCNNEILKMQRLPLEQLSKFQGIEYIVLHCQEPILYVIRKQERISPVQVSPIADYYIIAGVVYQAPDLSSLINSRLLTAVHNLQSAFEESYSFSRYHPSKGYWFEFGKDGDKDSNKDKADKSKDKTKEEVSSSTLFQRRKVDVLLASLTKKFPPKLIQPTAQHQSQASQQSQQQSNDKTDSSAAAEDSEKTSAKSDQKSDQTSGATTVPTVNSGSFRSSGGPPEKKQRIN